MHRKARQKTIQEGVRAMSVKITTYRMETAVRVVTADVRPRANAPTHIPDLAVHRRSPVCSASDRRICRTAGDAWTARSRACALSSSVDRCRRRRHYWWYSLCMAGRTTSSTADSCRCFWRLAYASAVCRPDPGLNSDGTSLARRHRGRIFWRNCRVLCRHWDFSWLSRNCRGDAARDRGRSAWAWKPSEIIHGRPSIRERFPFASAASEGHLTMRIDARRTVLNVRTPRRAR